MYVHDPALLYGVAAQQRTGEFKMDTDSTNPGFRMDTLDAFSRQSKLYLESTAKVDFGALSHPGKVRKNNEDHYFVSRLGRSIEPLLTNIPQNLLPDRLAEYGYGMLVADGMGGAAAGEVASRMAISLLVKLVVDTAKWGRHIDELEAEALMERMENYYTTIHSELVRQGEIDPSVAGMGTTLTVVYSFCSDLFVAHVGDSRAYLFREGQLRQLTRDHTVAQKLADKGDIPQEAVSKHRLRHILTNVIGGHSGPLVTDIQQFHLADCDRLLLCSDGLTDMVDDVVIADVLDKIEPPQEACEKLLDLALNAGGKDNITIILANYAFSEAAADRE
jgi:serine/threonine protein phosphatase PrpC